MLCVPFLSFLIVRGDLFFLIQLVRTLPSGAAVRAVRQFAQFGPTGEAEHRTRNARFPVRVHRPFRREQASSNRCIL